MFVVCGCDTDFLEFTSEDEASIAAFQLTEEGKGVDMGNACPACYDEFFLRIIQTVQLMGGNKYEDPSFDRVFTINIRKWK